MITASRRKGNIVSSQPDGTADNAPNVVDDSGTDNSEQTLSQLAENSVNVEDELKTDDPPNQDAAPSDEAATEVPQEEGPQEMMRKPKRAKKLPVTKNHPVKKRHLSK